MREELISPRLSVVLLKGLRHLDEPHYLEAEAVRKVISKTEKLTSKGLVDVLEACYDLDMYNFELLHKLESETSEKYNVLDQFKVAKCLYKFGYLSKKLLPAIINSSDQFLDTLNTKDLFKLLEIVSDGSHKVEISELFVNSLITRLQRVNFTDISLGKYVSFHDFLKFVMISLLDK